MSGAMPRLGRFSGAVASTGVRERLLVTVLYTLAHGLMLVNGGIYWDDWVLVGVDPQTIQRVFWAAGSPQTGYFHSWLLSLPHSVFVYHAIVFVSFLLSALLVYEILGAIPSIGSRERIWLTLFFALFPVNSGRIALINTPYAVGHLLFFFGFWLTTKWRSAPRAGVRGMALVAMYLSFTVNSLLVYYGLVILYLVWHENRSFRVSWFAAKSLLSYSDFLLLPVLYWAVKQAFFVPYGLYADHYSITAARIVKAPLFGILTLHTSFFQVIWSATKSFAPFGLVGGLVGLAAYQRNRSRAMDFATADLPFFLLGCLAFFLAVFPYLVVNRVPRTEDWENRHQLLVPLGASLMLFYGVRLLLRRFRWGRPAGEFAYSFLLAAFLVANITYGLGFFRDAYKQAALLEAFRSSEILRESSTLLVLDNTRELNANNRGYRFYEYSGLFKKVFHSETRFAAEAQSFRNIEDFFPYFGPDYNLGGYRPTKPQYLMTINQGSLDIRRVPEVLKLMRLEAFDESGFRKAIPGVVSVAFERLP